MKTAIGIASGVAGYLLVKFLILGGGGDALISKELVDCCSQINSTLPMMVDANTRMDNAAPGPGKKITYFYTIVDVDPDLLNDAMFKQVEEGARGRVKHSSDLKIFRENGVDMRYVYRDEGGRELYEFTIDH